MPSLVDLWKSDSTLLTEKSFRQIIQVSGDGRLADGSMCSQEVRRLLSAVPLEELRRFAEECLAESFQDSGLALQDVANQLGVRLGFDVVPGRYRGARGQPGHDGLWRSKDGHAIVVEVKTTDAYRMSIDTVAKYRDQLVETQLIDGQRSSMLIAVGRQDTGDLEAQIRGSKHAWDVRLISVDALIRLAEVKEQLSNWQVSIQINRLLRPMEYTRVDGIVDLLFQTSRDIEDAEDSEPDDQENSGEREAEGRGPQADYEPAKATVLERLSEKREEVYVRKGRALRSSSDGRTNVVLLASKAHERSGAPLYWYGVTQAHLEFLRDAEHGVAVFVFSDTCRGVAIPRDVLASWCPDLLTTPPDAASEQDIKHWHVYLNDQDGQIDLIPRSGLAVRNVAEFEV